MRVKANGHTQIHNTNITASTTGYEAIWLWNNASMMLQGTSVVTAPAGITGINMTTGSTAVLGDDVQINSVDQNAIQVDKNGTVEINDNVIVSRSDGNSAIFVDPTSALRINGSDISISGVSCAGITSYVEDGSNNSVNLSNTCNGYQNLIPNFISITSGTCESNGLKSLISEHECALSLGKQVDLIVERLDRPRACYKDDVRSYWNTAADSVSTGDEDRQIICKE